MTTHIYENLPEMHPSGTKSSARHLASGVCASDMKKFHADTVAVQTWDLMLFRPGRAGVYRVLHARIGGEAAVYGQANAGDEPGGVGVQQEQQHADEIFTEAENRLHVQKAVLVFCCL